MRHYARFFALVFIAFAFAVSADFNRALAQTATPTPTPVQVGQVIISELRLRGPAGVEDEYIEIYNNTDSAITVQALDDTNGWTVVLSTGEVTEPVFTIPNGTPIPARGHLLGANQNGYSLCNYPSGNGLDGIGGTTAPAIPPSPCLTNGIGGTFTHTTPDITWDFDVPDGAGIALFATTNSLNYTAATRLDAVGFTGSPAFYKEGGGIPTVVGLNAEHAYYRDLRNGTPRDTGDNATDFLLVGTSVGLQITRLGAPGPENLNSPIVNNSTINPALLDPAVSSASFPNRERIPDAEPNGELGSMYIRRRITNNTGLPISRLRFRVVIITTLGTPASECPAPSCADLRALTSNDEAIATSGEGIVPVRGLRLEQPPEQPAGGGYNSSLSEDETTLLTPLLPGQSINVVFKLGVMRDGPFRFFMNIEAQNSTGEGIDGPAGSGVGGGGGTDFNKRKLIIDTVRTAPSAAAAPASPAAAPSAAPRNVYVPLFINTTPRAAKPSRAADEEADKEDEEKEKEKKSEEAQPATQPAPQTPEASAPETPADDNAAPQPAPAKKSREASKKRPAAAKAASRGEQ